MILLDGNHSTGDLAAGLGIILVLAALCVLLSVAIAARLRGRDEEAADEPEDPDRD